VNENKQPVGHEVQLLAQYISIFYNEHVYSHKAEQKKEKKEQQKKQHAA